MKFSQRIENIVRKILRKNKVEAVAIMEEVKPKPKGLKLKGTKVVIEPKATLVRHKPRKRIQKVDAVNKTKEAEVMRLIKTDPKAALKLASKIDLKAKAERNKRTRFVALSPLEQERETERIETIEKAALTLIANLPKVSEIDLDPNWSQEVLHNHIGEAAFRSSLESNVLWIAIGKGGLSVKVNAVTIDLKGFSDLLDGVALKLWNWSGMDKSLNKDGEEVRTQNLIWALSNAAASYSSSQAKLKSSEYYLEQLVENSITTPLKYTKGTATRTEVLEALSLVIAEQAIELGFRKDKSRNIQIDSSDNRYCTSEITKKILIPILDLIIKGSSVAGKLKSSKDAEKLYFGFLNYLPL